MLFSVQVLAVRLIGSDNSLKSVERGRLRDNFVVTFIITLYKIVITLIRSVHVHKLAVIENFVPCKIGVNYLDEDMERRDESFTTIHNGSDKL